MSLLGSWGGPSNGQVQAPDEVESAQRAAQVEQLKTAVQHKLLDLLGPTLYDPHMPGEELAQKIRSTLQLVVEGSELVVPEQDRSRVTREILDDILGYGPICLGM